VSSTDNSKFELKRGDLLWWQNYPNCEITVRRVAKDQSWADLFIYDKRTLTSWTKRQRLPIAGSHGVLR
jgi:hypothetical protein